jgi:hypothetical protein
MRTHWVSAVVIGASAIICSLIIAQGLERLAPYAGSKSGRYLLQRETTEGWFLLDTEAGRACFVTTNTSATCTRAPYER